MSHMSDEILYSKLQRQLQTRAGDTVSRLAPATGEARPDAELRPLASPEPIARASCPDPGRSLDSAALGHGLSWLHARIRRAHGPR